MYFYRLLAVVMKSLVLLLMCFPMGMHAYAQLDSIRTSIPLDNPVRPLDSQNQLPNISFRPPQEQFSLVDGSNNSSMLDRNSTDNFTFSNKSKETPVMTSNGDVVYRKFDYKPKWLEEEKVDHKQFQKNQYLGDYKSNGKYVTIRCRDHQYVDGDKVRVFINDEVIESEIYLVSKFKEFNIEIKQGFNKIDFQALNQGSSGPNTAEFSVHDENGIPLAHNIWNLATGYKATLIVVKDQ